MPAFFATWVVLVLWVGCAPQGEIVSPRHPSDRDARDRPHDDADTEHDVPPWWEDDDVVPDPERDVSGVPGPVPGLARLHASFFEPKCGACHIEGAVAAGGFSLRLDEALLERLLAPSSQAPALRRVEAGDPDASYLWHKVRGTHTEVGGAGGRMPLGQSALTDADVALLLRWIVAGAPLREEP